MYDTLGSLYRTFARPFFFRIDPEDIHDRMTSFGSFLGKFWITKTATGLLFDYESEKLEQRIVGIKFKSPVGLSAGFDKNAELVEILPFVSFGYSQVGSVTNRAYKGNPKPRLYRLPKSKGLVVYYGLKNIGATKIIKRLKYANIPKDFPISISIAKTNSKATSTVAKGVKDYYDCMLKFEKADIGSFYTINISCPNTFGGEPFTTPVRLEKLLKKLSTIGTKRPVFVKMPINLSWKDFEALLKMCVRYKINGVVIGNLNKDRNRPEIKDEIPNEIKGGISGLPTKELSNTLIERTYKKYGKKLVIVGVGGVFSADDAYEKMRKGASLVQLITGMIYEGPQLISQINKGLVERMEKDGFKSISEVVGSSFK